VRAIQGEVDKIDPSLGARIDLAVTIEAHLVNLANLLVGSSYQVAQQISSEFA